MFPVCVSSDSVSSVIGGYSHQLLSDFLGYDLLTISVLSFLTNKYYQANELI